jgi:hypothetical protein
MGPFGSSGFKTGACQIDPFSKSGDFETGRIDHSGFEIGEVVRLVPRFQNWCDTKFWLGDMASGVSMSSEVRAMDARPEHCELITTHNEQTGVLTVCPNENGDFYAK